MKQVLLIIIMGWFNFAIGQTNIINFHRVKISLENTTIQQLVNWGVAIDHGNLRSNQSFTSDFSDRDLEILEAHNIEYHIIINDITKHYQDQNKGFIESPLFRAKCEESRIPSYPVPNNYRYGSMGGYLTYDELLLTLDTMRLLFPNLISEKKPIEEFRTAENRPIHWLRISNNPDEEQIEKPQVLYTALHHAREPNSLSQMIFYIWYLLENYETNDEVKFLVDHTEMYFVPCVNPDGYVYNGSKNPTGGGYWRKNRRENGNEEFGVDLNRNYGDHWAFPGGASTDPKSDVYKGTAPFSEPETQAIKTLCESHQFEIALNYHTYGNLLIHPYGFKDSVTIDDTVFKSIGSILTKYNNYLVGTGSETVGYLVTGDSDDWMYGEQVTKPKILSMTPEVGPQGFSFWPPKSAIIRINQGVMFQNLATAHVLHEYISFLDNSVAVLDEGNNSITLSFKNFGLKAGTVDVSIESLSDKLTFLGTSTTELELDPIQSTDLSFNYELATIQGKEEVSWIVHINHGSYISHDTIYQYIYGEMDVIAQAKELIDWNNTTIWGNTTSTFYSSPSCISDSPDGKYSNRQELEIRMGKSIDLSDYKQAYLSFFAKWEIEKGYDYVQVMASLTGIDYIPLCGNYTNLGTSDQDADQPVYDGIQADWIEETVDLSDFVGEDKVYIKFRLVSDPYQTGDGFFFDDFEVIGLKTSDVANDDFELKKQIEVFPNPFREKITIRDLNQNGNLYQLKVRNILGELVMDLSLVSEKIINTSNWVSGVYLIELSNESGQKSIFRVSKN